MNSPSAQLTQPCGTWQGTNDVQGVGYGGIGRRLYCRSCSSVSSLFLAHARSQQSRIPHSRGHSNTAVDAWWSGKHYTTFATANLKSNQACRPHPYIHLCTDSCLYCICNIGIGLSKGSSLHSFAVLMLDDVEIAYMLSAGRASLLAFGIVPCQQGRDNLQYQLVDTKRRLRMHHLRCQYLSVMLIAVLMCHTVFEHSIFVLFSISLMGSISTCRWAWRCGPGGHTRLCGMTSSLAGLCTSHIMRRDWGLLKPMTSLQSSMLCQPSCCAFMASLRPLSSAASALAQVRCLDCMHVIAGVQKVVVPQTRQIDGRGARCSYRQMAHVKMLEVACCLTSLDAFAGMNQLA